jgi:hypothetical protein
VTSVIFFGFLLSKVSIFLVLRFLLDLLEGF